MSVQFNHQFPGGADLDPTMKTPLSQPTVTGHLFSTGCKVNALIRRHAVCDPLFGVADRYVSVVTASLCVHKMS